MATPIKHTTPPLPAPLVLEDEKFVRCPNEDPTIFVCMDHANANKVVRNKSKAAEYVSQSRTVFDFFKRREEL